MSPIGMRPGVLFSALHACQAENGGDAPAQCLVICSPDTESLIAEAVERAAYAGRIELLLLDPHGDSGEIKGLKKSARQHFIGATEVVVNVTGGTTLMGLAAEALANVARELACPVRRFGLIDCCTPREQEMDPYRVGKPFWLDDPANGDEADNH